MGVYVFKTDVLLKLLKWRYPTSNDFGSEIIPASVKEYNVQVREITLSPLKCFHNYSFVEVTIQVECLFCLFFRHFFSETIGKTLEQ